MIQTVTGAIAPETLGHFQPHEHLYVKKTPAALRYPALAIDDAEKSAREACAYRAAGGGALLDAQPVGAGRDANALCHISRASGVPIVAVTGYHRPMFYEKEHWIFTDDEAALTERFVRELSQGMDEAPALRAGAVKAAIGGELPEGREKCKLRAAARAAAACGVPLVLHTEAGQYGALAVSLCEGAGLNPARVLVCHADRQAADYAPHEEIARTGAYLEYDTVGRFKYHDDEAEIRLILHMLEKGCEDRLLLSLDTTAGRLAAYGGEIGLTYLLTAFLPALNGAGVSPATVRRIVCDNPARPFAPQI